MAFYTLTTITNVGQTLNGGEIGFLPGTGGGSIAG